MEKSQRRLEKIQKRLKQLRNEKGYTIREASEKLETTKTTLSRYENGKREPKLHFIQNAAELYDVSVDYILGNTDIRNDPNPKIKEAIEKDPELYHFWDELSKREDLRLLFKHTKNLPPEAIKSIIQFIEAIESKYS